MEKSQILIILSLASLLAILFTPSNKNYWVWFLVLGIIFGIFWLIGRD